MMEPYRHPKISISRANKLVGLFDGLDIVREFQPYTDEQEAIREAKEWFSTRSTVAPETVYPVIRRMWAR